MLVGAGAVVAAVLRGQTRGVLAAGAGAESDAAALGAVASLGAVGMGAIGGGGTSVTAGAAGFGGVDAGESPLPSQIKSAPSTAAAPSPTPSVHRVKRRLLRANWSSRSSGSLGGARLAATPTVESALTPDAPPLGGRDEKRPLPCEES